MTSLVDRRRTNYAIYISTNNNCMKDISRYIPVNVSADSRTVKSVFIVTQTSS